MAQFYARIEGNRGPATRLGSKSSGMTARINGWNVGVLVLMDHQDGHDVVTVYRTGGSNARTSNELIAEFSDEN
jgi:hypothetical protein